MKYTLLTVVTLGLIVPAAIGVTVKWTPDTALRTGSAGTFVSAIASAGGVFTPPVTSVQSSTGSIAVQGAFSAVRSQSLIVREGLKSGMQLCVEGQPRTCSALAGVWPGELVPVAHSLPWSAPLAKHFDPGLIAPWLMLGGLATFITFVARAAKTTPPDP